ncbi:hypothetical protein HK100_010379 [Physocladia obscura]|uniref:DnaJ homologue subfamily C member 28 conserved domain-containing protein n=1 Tax=Physocladia obscura TaxID=109957 RepID=A0AAD5XKU9_9FUNG|nr:hypothetical protein HK100_010379 [Physocladia obscura]
MIVRNFQRSVSSRANALSGISSTASTTAKAAASDAEPTTDVLPSFIPISERIHNHTADKDTKKPKEPFIVDATLSHEVTQGLPTQIDHEEINAEIQKRTANVTLSQILKRVARDAFVASEKPLSATATPEEQEEAFEKRFLLLNKQANRKDSVLNPSVGIQPDVTNRIFLEGPNSVSAIAAKSPFKNARIIKASHAKQDSETYKTPTQQLFEDYMTIRPTFENFDSLVEQRIATAQRAGQFDDLPGKGKPIRFDTDDRLNVHMSDTEYFMNNVMKSQNARPAWIEIGKEIAEETLKLRKELKELHEQCVRPPHQNTSFRIDSPSLSFGLAAISSWLMGSNTVVAKKIPQQSNEPASFQWKKRGKEWATLRITAINKRINDYNLQSPGGATKKLLLNVNDELAKVEKNE